MSLYQTFDNCMYTYLLLNVFTLLGPLLYSFEKQVTFYKKWKFAFPAIFITGAVFIIWDVWFTELGVWSFNPEYLVGPHFFSLPIEEWLFFLTVPFACLFIYEILKLFPVIDTYQVPAKGLTGVMSLALLVFGIFIADGMYTRVNFLLAGTLLGLNLIFNNKDLPRFWVSYFIQLVPFLIVNGILTALPVVTYNDAENLGIRLGTIPIEDTIYSLSLLLMNVNLYELMQKKR